MSTIAEPSAAIRYHDPIAPVILLIAAIDVASAIPATAMPRSSRHDRRHAASPAASTTTARPHGVGCATGEK